MDTCFGFLSMPVRVLLCKQFHGMFRNVALILREQNFVKLHGANLNVKITIFI